jgi:hypothetical protein
MLTGTGGDATCLVRNENSLMINTTGFGYMVLKELEED